MNLRELHTEESRYALLSEFALSLSKVSDMQALNREVVPKLKYMIDFNRCTLALGDQKERTYRLLVLLETRRGLSREDADHIPMERGISGKAMLSGEMQVHGGCGGMLAEEWPIADDAMEGGSLNSIMCLPLQVGGKPFGAITFGSTEQVGYSRADVSAASIVAMHLSLALDRWDMIQKLRSANEEIRDLNAALEKRVAERTRELEKTNEQLSQEVSIRQRAEEALRESELKYRAIFTEARDGISLVDSKTGQIVECNPEFERQTGRKLAELKLMKVWQLRPSGKVEKAKKIFKAVVGQGEGQSDTQFETPSGERVEVDLRAKCVEIGNKKYALSIVRDITERKRSEEEMRKKSEIFKNAHWGMAISTAKGALDQLNPAFAEMHGYSVSELRGRPIREVYAPEVRSDLRARLQTIERRGHLAWETKHVRKDGSTFPVLMNVYGVRDAKGKLLYRVANVIDISDQKQAEEALRESEERYRSLYTKTPIMLHSIGANGRLLSVSDYWLENLGYERDEVIGHRVSGFLTPISRESIEKVFLPEFFKTGLLKDVELQFVTKKGQTIDVLLSAIAERDAEGQFVRSMAVLVDVTERNRAEQELIERMQLSTFSANIGGVLTYGRDLQEMLQRCTEEMVESLDVVLARVWTVDKTGEVLVMQASAGMYTHIDGEHGRVPIGQYKIGLIAEGGKPHWTNDVTNDPRVHDKQWAKEQRLVAFAGYPLIFEDEVVGVMAMFSRKPFSRLTFDGLTLTANAIAVGIKRAQADEALREAKELLELRVEERTAELSEANELLASRNAELQKRTAEVEAANQELETFAYTVSHDLRSPLLTINGFSQILAEDFGDKLNEKGQGYLDLIQSNSTRMAQIIEDLLGLSKVTQGEISYGQVDLTQLAGSIAQNLETREPERRVEFAITPNLTVYGDSRLLKLALENLIGNAWKFTSKHQTARIELGKLDSKGKTVYYVRDDGAGFDSKSTVKLFAPFQRLHSENEFDGTGVGLATVQRIIHRHGGKIWAEGEVDKGATFYFTLRDSQ